MVFEPPPIELPPAEPPPDPDGHPIRVVVTDDLERSRLTVAVRWVLAIPLFLWWFVWSFGAFLVGIVNWFATLITGRSPDSVHDFFVMYIRYSAHVYAYSLLAANPYPGFMGNKAYPLDVQVAASRAQSRWKTFFRIFLAFPALVLAGFLVGFPMLQIGYTTNGQGQEVRFFFVVAGALFGLSFFAWLACLVKGRMPPGIRDLMAYGIRYALQAWGYFFLLTDRYPNADPAQPPALPPEKPRFLRLELEDDLRRSRLTVFFRFLLFLPHYVWLYLWSLLAYLAMILNWFATLILGRAPSFLHRFLTAYLRYRTHVFAYVTLVGNPFPGFTGKGGIYPVDLAIGERERQHRLKTLFRAFLAIPASSFYLFFWLFLLIVSIFSWFAALVLGRMPQGFRNAGAWALRYTAEAEAYFYVLTDVYPYSGPWEFAPPLPVPLSLEIEPEPGPVYT